MKPANGNLAAKPPSHLVRVAQVEDLYPIAALACQREPEADPFRGLFDPSKFVHNWSAWMQNGAGHMVVAEACAGANDGRVTSAAGIILGRDDSSEDLFASIIFWCVPERAFVEAMALLRMLEEHARLMGARRIFLALVPVSAATRKGCLQAGYVVGPEPLVKQLGRTGP